MASLTILRPGMLTTIQDLGRWGHQASGVPVAGPMDEYSHRLANGLVGNPQSAAALEITLLGPEIATDADIICAVTGAQFHLTVDGAAVPSGQPFMLRAGTSLRFGERTLGARAYFAVRGGIVVESVFASRATSLVSHMGPFGGRALRAADVLPVGGESGLFELSPIAGADSVSNSIVTPTLSNGRALLRVMRGPQERQFTPGAYETLFRSAFQITTHSNRMGYRLEGPPLAHAGSADILSDATPVGSMQVPGSGRPILLMADRQTTGGYPKIAVVITADLPIAGQLAPGDWIEFTPCTREAALNAHRARYRALEGFPR